MNFDNYFELLQTSKPVLNFAIIDHSKWTEITKQHFQIMENYLVTNEVDYQIRRQLFSLLGNAQHNFVHSIFCSQNFLELYDFCNFYLVFRKELIENSIGSYLINEKWETMSSYEYKLRTLEAIKRVTEKAQLKELYKGVFKVNHSNLDLDLIEMAFKNFNNCYFRLSLATDDYFTLEIIIVIHKVIA